MRLVWFTGMRAIKDRNDIQKIRTQIEQHQAEQEQVLRRTMSVPEKELREKSYSFKEAANILGIVK